MLKRLLIPCTEHMLYKLYNPVIFVNGCCLVVDEIKIGRYY